jgi:phosphoribosylanthranilate isomerase
MVRVKICGIKSADDAHAVADAGADFLGFHVGLIGARSPLEAVDAGKVMREMPDGSPVAVTSVSEPGRLVELARKTGAAVLQLYGDATPQQIAEVKAAMPPISVWKVINIAGDEAIAEAKKYDGVTDAIVLDRARRDGARGGSGQTLDWDIAKSIVEAVSTPVILAGGLNPENVAEAIHAVQPYGVDVNSGVTNPDGSKDLAKVKLFIERAKSVMS